VLALGFELRQRGHTVSFCASASYRTTIEPLGFQFHCLAPDLTPRSASAKETIQEIMDPNWGVERFLRKYLFPHLRATYDDLSRAVAADGGTDLLLSGELVYPAPLVAQKLGVPWASYITAPMSFFSAYDLPVLAQFPRISAAVRSLGLTANRAAIGLAKRTTRPWSEPIHRLRAELGLKPGADPIYEGKHSPQLVLALFSSVLAAPQPDWPENTVVTGFPFYDGPAEPEAVASALKKFLPAGDPPIVFTLGSAVVLDPGNFYKASVEAAALLKRRAVLLLGNNPPPANLPASVLAVNYARFSQLFPHASVIVHQGGIGTTAQALCAGRPMLVMPYNYDQPDNAARVVRLGAGRTISRKDYSAARVGREIARLLDDSSYLRAAQAIATTVQRERGVESACDALERLLCR
jgi:UDP:flavonoid glycosyltransferase YjiC (YdhE family)